jgi:lipopolysaccharide export system protein LptA
MWITLSRSLPDWRGALSGAALVARRPLAVVLGAIALLAAAQVMAQKNQPSPQASQGPPNALQGLSQNKDQPVTIQADKLEVRDKDKMATFTGNVHVVQGDTEMRSRQLVVFYEETSKPGAPNGTGAKAPPPAASGDQQQIKWIEATGGVRVTQKDQNAVGDKGTFDMRSNVVTLIGNVVVTRGKDVVRGERLVVDLNTGVSRIESAAGGQVQSLFQSGGQTSTPPARPPH